jgi:hypothetical protein
LFLAFLPVLLKKSDALYDRHLTKIKNMKKVGSKKAKTHSVFSTFDRSIFQNLKQFTCHEQY